MLTGKEVQSCDAYEYMSKYAVWVEGLARWESSRRIVVAVDLAAIKNIGMYYEEVGMNKC